MQSAWLSDRAVCRCRNGKEDGGHEHKLPGLEERRLLVYQQRESLSLPSQQPLVCAIFVVVVAVLAEPQSGG